MKKLFYLVVVAAMFGGGLPIGQAMAAEHSPLVAAGKKVKASIALTLCRFRDGSETHQPMLAPFLTVDHFFWKFAHIIAFLVGAVVWQTVTFLSDAAKAHGKKKSDFKSEVHYMFAVFPQFVIGTGLALVLFCVFLLFAIYWLAFDPNFGIFSFVACVFTAAVLSALLVVKSVLNAVYASLILLNVSYGMVWYGTWEWSTLVGGCLDWLFRFAPDGASYVYIAVTFTLSVSSALRATYGVLGAHTDLPA